MGRDFFSVLIAFLLWGALLAGIIYLFRLVVKALKAYIASKEVREEKEAVRQSLGEVIKAHRLQCQMTQEFVAESLGVSRQAVSKWESGSADPSTSNLVALAKLFGVTPEELLKEAQG
jgi:DNA-binding XRE family transcriptional regulator